MFYIMLYFIILYSVILHYIIYSILHFYRSNCSLIKIWAILEIVGMNLKPKQIFSGYII